MKQRQRNPLLIWFSRVLVAMLLTLPLTVPLTGLLSAAHPLYAQGEEVNLIPDPGFETEEDPWQACGDATQVDAQLSGVTPAMVHSGRYAARIHYNTDVTTCGSPFFQATAQLWQGFTVPDDAQDVTVSFWYSRVGATYFPLQPILGIDTGDSEADVALARVEVEELEGWNFYRTELNVEELEAVRGQSINLFFSIFTPPGQSTRVANTSPNTSPTTSAPGSYYIDDVRVTTTIERTTTSPLPADLQGDGTRPLVYLNNSGVARINSDGSGLQQLYAGLANSPLNPVWSSAGDRIAVLDNWLVPENNADPNVNPAFITILSTLNADGSNPQEIYRTNGIPGQRSTPVENEIPALDVQIRSMDWSPDDQSLALTICSNNRGLNGSTSDARCWVEIIGVVTGQSIRKIESAYRPSWSSDNRILFEDTDAYQNRADGIWETNLNTNPITERLVVTGTGAQSAPSLRTENWAVWSPDNTQFATVRDVAGYHYNANGTRAFHDAIMLFDRATLVGKSVLLVDHGTEPANLTWSPNGKYLLYSLFEGNNVDIWWLDVTSGKTGKVTTNGASIAANWRPACEGASCDPPPGAEQLLLPLIRP